MSGFRSILLEDMQLLCTCQCPTATMSEFRDFPSFRNSVIDTGLLSSSCF